MKRAYHLSIVDLVRRTLTGVDFDQPEIIKDDTKWGDLDVKKTTLVASKNLLSGFNNTSPEMKVDLEPPPSSSGPLTCIEGNNKNSWFKLVEILIAVLHED